MTLTFLRSQLEGGLRTAASKNGRALPSPLSKQADHSLHHTKRLRLDRKGTNHHKALTQIQFCSDMTCFGQTAGLNIDSPAFKHGRNQVLIIASCTALIAYVKSRINKQHL